MMMACVDGYDAMCDDDGLRCGLVWLEHQRWYLGTTKVLLIPTYQFFKYSLKCKHTQETEFHKTHYFQLVGTIPT